MSIAGIFVFHLSANGWAATVPSPGLLEMRVNAGGEDYLDQEGRLWFGDTGYNAGRKSALPARNCEPPTDVLHTEDEFLYLEQRWNPSENSDLEYHFNVPDGDYVVKLHFAETWCGAYGEGLRVFDVAIEGEHVIDDLDIYAEVGPDAIAIKTARVTVRDGQLNIVLSPIVQNPRIAAIEIVQQPDGVMPPATGVKPGLASNLIAGSGGIRVNAGGGDYIDQEGRLWVKDAGYNAGNIVALPRESCSYPGDVAFTDENALYLTQRWSNGARSTLTYRFAVPPGAYLVKLHFAETWCGAFGEGKRVFDIVLEGQTVVDDVDLYREAGDYTALVKTIPVDVVDGELHIELLAEIQNPTIAAIEVTPDAGPLGSAAVASSAGSPTLMLSWDAVSVPNSGYKVYYGPTPETAVYELSDLAETGTGFDPDRPGVQYDAATDLGVSGADQACFRVRSYNSFGISAFSQAVCTGSS